ncbi:MAG: hypothetical protein V1818_03050 [Candidatus Aenigmatarchaeota archaeon]
MANIDSMDMKNDKILVKLELTKKEYGLLKQSTKKLLLLPTEMSILSESLTTGKLGNSNRIMLPNKILKRHDISLIKKAPSQVFDLGDEKFLLIKLQESTIGKPVFGDE